MTQTSLTVIPAAIRPHQGVVAVVREHIISIKVVFVFVQVEQLKKEENSS
jgi:hypothetical protein